jgi:hypothetical protein
MARLFARDPHTGEVRFGIFRGRRAIVKKTTFLLLLACVLALATASAASAQGPDQPARLFVNVNGGVQTGAHTLTQAGTFTLYDETGSFTGSGKIKSGPFFDVGAGVHVVGALSVGVTYSHFQKTTDAPFAVVAPHPLFYGQPRNAALNVTGLNHSENVFHVQAFYQLLSSGRYEASVFAGPSFYSVKQDSVTSVTATETAAPYTTVNLAAGFTSSKKSTVGVNAGMEITYRVSGPLAAGLLVRYSAATAKLASGDVKVGGPQVGVTLKYRF